MIVLQLYFNIMKFVRTLSQRDNIMKSEKHTTFKSVSDADFFQ